jgi:hypothetical protein
MFWIRKFFSSWIPDLGVKKALDPGPQHCYAVWGDPKRISQIEFGSKIIVNIVNYLVDLKKAGFRVRINLIRIRIEQFRLNTDPDPGF